MILTTDEVRRAFVSKTLRPTGPSGPELEKAFNAWFEKVKSDARADGRVSMQIQIEGKKR